MISISTKSTDSEETELNANSMLDQSFYELAAYYDVLSSSSVNHGIMDITIDQLRYWLKNPPKFRKQLIQISKFFYNRNGIITDIYNIFNTLPLLNYSIHWDNMKQKGFVKNKKIIESFIKKIDAKKLTRDTIFTVIQEGTCVWYNRDNKYIQFMEPDEIMIDYQKNGKWQVYYDFRYIEQYNMSHNMAMIHAKIESAPDEVTIHGFLNYKKDREKYRYVPLDIDKTQVIKLRGTRNEPFGVPYCVPAISSIMHYDLLEKSEAVVADRLISQLFHQKVGNMPSADGKIGLPVPKPTVDGYHSSLKNLLQKKIDSNTKVTENVLTTPAFVTIEALKVNMETFKKDTWDRITNDIYAKLGYSPSLNMGGGGGQSFGSSTINVEKIYSIIFFIVEQIENGLNEYMNILVPSGNVNASIMFSRDTILDKKTSFAQAMDLFTKARGSWKDVVEASGRNFEHWLQQVELEDEMGLDKKLKIHLTSYTATDATGGRPSDGGAGSGNDNTDNSKGNGGNDIPSPSDGG